jgi:ABC-2 type transport system ATP-binding protein
MTTSSAVPIRVEHVSKRFDRTLALDDVSFEVPAGSILGLLGPNGAGKTTLIRSMLDIIRPDSGHIEIFGEKLKARDRDHIGYLPEERGLYPRQPVGAVLEYLGCLKGMTPAAARAESSVWLERFGLADVRSKKVEQLSKGNQQKVQLAATLLSRPAVVILDEPLSGLDPVSARLAHGVIRSLAAEGQTVVLSTHQMSTVETLCTRVFMLTHGRAVLDGELRDIKRRFASRTVRVHSTADYRACPFVSSVVPDPWADQAVDIHLREPATPEDLLRWLVERQAAVFSFEQLSSSLDDIFVQVAQEAVAETVS